MAISSETIRTNYPLPVYNYRVEIGSEVVAFSEVSGLTISYECCTSYAESPIAAQPGANWFYFPGQVQPVTLTMKKGVVRQASIKFLYSWIQTIQTNQVEKKDIYIRLCDEKGEPVISWKAGNAFPFALSAPSFEAASNDAAIETLQLCADFVTLEET
ncbi:MAG: phage tail protein [Cyanobacteriota bacterium]|nr:phage tail protein [Cyanobacteriota bacterium]